MQPVRKQQNGLVQITEFKPDWNDLAWFTMKLLGAEGTSPGTNVAILTHFFQELTPKFPDLGTIFVNPQFVVSSPESSAAFFREADRAQITWFKTLKDVFVHSGIRKQRIKREDRLMRQLCFTGIMIVEGKYLCPDVWRKRYQQMIPSNVRKQHNKRFVKPNDLEGQRFERLVVLHRASNGDWQCRCDCGTEKPIKGCHLRSGRTKSCGCLKAQVEKRQKARKQARQWLQSGHL